MRDIPARRVMMDAPAPHESRSDRRMADDAPPQPEGPDAPVPPVPDVPVPRSDLPPGIPSSPTGRVPQWVLDEAAGRPAEPVPFRSWAPPDAGTRFGTPAPRRKRGAAVAVLLVAALALGAVLWGARVPERVVAEPDGPVPTLPTGTASPQAPAGRPDSAGPVPGFEETARPSGLRLSSLKKQPGYVFSNTQKDKRTGVAWSPCRPIHYVLRGAKNAPRQGERMLRESLARIAELTGLEIVDDGTTAEKYSDKRKAYQPRRYGQRWVPVLISWSTTSEDRGLKGDVLGRAGGQWVTTDSGDRAYVTGTVSLDAAQINRIRSQFGYDVARAVVLHELGHLVGLGHVEARDALMNPTVSPDVTDFSAAERAGLKALGSGPCQPDV
ncbi:MAG: matrixin family metalloprotease [Candidatus Nanopelagicales bacterium]